ncbi:MAG: helix-turn-helix domain-containing protein [Betaproteobacteria bacterium]|nr:helix-turn-helix domain-containing protein [Betaproteobacteria bacterium]
MAEMRVHAPHAQGECAPGFRTPKVRCRLCCLQEFCEPEGLERGEIDFLKTFVKKQELRLRRGEHPYRQGDEFRALIALHTGSLKVTVAAPDGTERVTRFAITGDMVGMEGIESGRHGDDAVALEESGACLLPWDRVEEAAARIPLVRRQLMRMLSREIRRGEAVGLLLGRLSAKERFAAFLLDLSDRFASRGLDGLRFRLSMSRPDIGSFLGLTPETVSRLFTEFRDESLLGVNAKQVKLLQPELLRALARQASPTAFRN